MRHKIKINTERFPNFDSQLTTSESEMAQSFKKLALAKSSCVVYQSLCQNSVCIFRLPGLKGAVFCLNLPSVICSHLQEKPSRQES